VVKCRNSKGISLEEQMRDVFDQHTEMDHNGIVTGGDGKLFCVRNGKLGERILRKLVKTPCRDIIEDLRDLFQDFYLFAEVAANLSEDSEDENERKRDLRIRKAGQIREANKKLSSSKWILETINRHLSSKWDVDDDGSLHKTMLRPDSAASKNRRKRKAEDKNGEKMTYNKRRRARLPPLSTEPSRGSFWSQGTHPHPHPHTHSDTLLGSSSGSATRVSTQNQSSDSYSCSSKAASEHR
jgi:hypothetical protein